MASVLALGVFAQWIAWRLKLPAIVLLLAFGLALGQIDGGDDSAQTNDSFFAMVSLAVGIILFEGGLTLNFREIRETRGVVLRLVTVGLLISWVLASVLAYYVAGFSLRMAVLLGALLTVSGPTVILPLLRHVQPVRRVGSLAKWEGVINDPIGAVLAALVFEVVLHGAHEKVAETSIYSLGVTLLVALSLCAVTAWALLLCLRRYWVPDFLQNPLILGLVLVVYALSNSIQPESGLVTVTVLGLVLANQSKVKLQHVVAFKENLRVLLISTLFIVLASRLELGSAALASVGWRVPLFVALLILLVRPVAVFLSTIGSPLDLRERAFLAWIHPRGIVAAAVSSLFALEITKSLGPEDPLSQEADLFVLTTFMVIVGTVLVYGLTLAPLARRLGVSGENPQGILFAGASPAVREIANAVQVEGYSVLLVDTNPRNIAAARMAGLPVSYASIGSEFVHEEVDLGGIGRLLAMTPNDEVNTLAAMGLSERFGWAEVYQVAFDGTKNEKRQNVGAYRKARILFAQPTTVSELEKRLKNGSVVKKTTISEDFTMDDFRARYGETAVPLFTMTEGGELVVATSDREVSAKAGQKLIALVDEAEGSGIRKMRAEPDGTTAESGGEPT